MANNAILEKIYPFFILKNPAELINNFSSSMFSLSPCILENEI